MKKAFENFKCLEIHAGISKKTLLNRLMSKLRPRIRNAKDGKQEMYNVLEHNEYML